MPRRPPEEPESVVFVIDRCLGRSEVAAALTNAGAIVELLDDHFDQNTEDVVWLDHAGKRGWVVLTKDKMIRRRANERRALQESKVAAFVLTGKDLSGSDMARAFVAALSRMLRVLQQYRRPLIATVSPAGTVTIKTGERRGGPKTP